MVKRRERRAPVVVVVSSCARSVGALVFELAGAGADGLMCAA